ncbi:MAG: PilZ domain-containing protein [Candidatus Rokubacteria bacterium]|nr:PilZ domain-containing protein [Candidatus Rokubacteria bacterium]
MASERRRYCRYPVSWPIRLWVSEHFFLAGRAVDASLHGMRISLVSWIPSGILRQGAAYRLDVRPELRGELRCTGQVRRVTEDGVALEIAEELPLTVGTHDSVDAVPGGTEPGGADDEPRGGTAASTALAGLAVLITRAVRGMSEYLHASIGERLEELALRAVHEALAYDWPAVVRTLNELSVLMRFVIRLEEVSAEECLAIRSKLAAAYDSVPTRT